MNSTEQRRIPPIQRTRIRENWTGWKRGLLVGCGIAALVPLGVACWLEPSPSGVGTHEQISWLPPCGFLLTTGKPCPSCGMTTAYAYFVRGLWPSAIEANAGGFLLALLSVPIAGWLVASASAGRWMGLRPGVPWIAGVSLMVTVAAMAQWLLR